MSVTIPPRAGQLIERLARVADRYHEPRVDTVAAEDAIQDHLRRLEVGRSTVRFVADFSTGHYSALAAVFNDDAWIGAWRAAWREAWQARVPWSTSRRFAQISARRAVAAASWHRLRAFVSANLASNETVWAPFRAVFEWAGDQALCDAIDSAVDVVSWSAEPEMSQRS